MQARSLSVIGAPTDVTQRESLAQLAETATAAFGDIHILCNNAGVASTGAGRSIAVWALPDADWDWVMGVNFWGVLYGLQAFVPRMLAHGQEGHILNTASAAAWTPGGGTYGVSKHAVLALSETLHRDLTSRGSLLGASVLCPGTVNTSILRAERNRPERFAGGSPPALPENLAAAEKGFATSMAPAVVARAALDAIRENAFYVLPHPAWDRLMRLRVETALRRREPLALDYADMMRRHAAGEQF